MTFNSAPILQDGYSPLYVASQNGHHEVVKVLCEHKALVNKISANGSTPLYVASQNGHTKCVEYLLKYKADHSISYGAGYRSVTSHFNTNYELETLNNVLSFIITLLFCGLLNFV
jgi:ankyrin repeat protein